MNDREFETYRAEAESVRAGVARDLQRALCHTGAEDRLTNICHMAEANLRYFFPQLDRRYVHELIGEILFQQRVALRDQSRYDLIARTQVSDEAGVLEDPRAARIYCTYHTGSYRHLLHLLGTRGIDCALYLSGRTRDLQGGSFIDDFAKAAATRHWRGRFETLDADNPRSLLHGVRALRRGYSAVIYIDGNSGSGTADERGACVDFFGRTLRVRSGVGYLSHLAQVPIVPALCLRARDASLSLQLQTPIAPPAGAERTDYAVATTQALFARLADAITDAPGQWEGWLYVHKQVQRQPADVPESAYAQPAAATHWNADQDRFAVLRFAEQAVLLDKSRHSCSLLDRTAESAFHAASNGAALALETATAAPTVAQLLRIGALRPAAAISG